MENNLVGVIGGLGPSATAYFMELVIENTSAEKDQDNVNMLICQHSSIPDRTNYILDKNSENPLALMVNDAKLLERENCKFIVIPCNTATYFYEEIDKNVNIPVLNIVKITSDKVLSSNPKKIGLMATDGTIKSKVYNKYITDDKLFIPNSKYQEKIMSIIYNYVKRNLTPDYNEFINVINYFKENNCDVVISGCTEISVALLKLNIKDDYIVDSLTELAKETIIKAGKNLK